MIGNAGGTIGKYTGVDRTCGGVCVFAYWMQIRRILRISTHDVPNRERVMGHCIWHIQQYYICIVSLPHRISHQFVHLYLFVPTDMDIFMFMFICFIS